MNECWCCRGSGYGAGHALCGSCQGDGLVPFDVFTCEECDGAGHGACPECNPLGAGPEDATPED
jgi:hypothetical protein